MGAEPHRPPRNCNKYDEGFYNAASVILNDCAHTIQQLLDINRCDTGIDVGHGVGDDHLVIMNDRTTGVDNIGNIALALFLMRGKQWLIQAGDDF
jgi:hypothetical protein